MLDWRQRFSHDSVQLGKRMHQANVQVQLKHRVMVLSIAPRHYLG